MGDIVNLNKFRKRKAKGERAKRADVNRRLHGRTKAERAREELQKQQLTRHVEGARLEPIQPPAGNPAPPGTDEQEGAPPSSRVE